MTNAINPMLGLVSLYKQVTDEWDGWSIFYSYICFTITLFAMVRNCLFNIILSIKQQYSVWNEHFDFTFETLLWY